jgi:hypothetical protein
MKGSRLCGQSYGYRQPIPRSCFRRHLPEMSTHKGPNTFLIRLCDFRLWAWTTISIKHSQEEDFYMRFVYLYPCCAGGVSRRDEDSSSDQHSGSDDTGPIDPTSASSPSPAASFCTSQWRDFTNRRRDYRGRGEAARQRRACRRGAGYGQRCASFERSCTSTEFRYGLEWTVRLSKYSSRNL